MWLGDGNWLTGNLGRPEQWVGRRLCLWRRILIVGVIVVIVSVVVIIVAVWLKVLARKRAVGGGARSERIEKPGETSRKTSLNYTNDRSQNTT